MRFLIVVLFLIMWSGMGHAAECIPLSRVKTDIAANPMFTGAMVADMGGTEAKAFLAAYNAFPPVSQKTGDYVVTIIPQNTGMVIAVIFTAGCVSDLLRPFPVPAFRKMLETL